MPRYKLTLEYHGASFIGWQRQAEGVSVQGVLEAACGRLEPGPHIVQGAGRTDAGVHATGQVAHVDMGADWDPFRLSEALNYHLKPHPVAVRTAERVADDFHARFSAVRRDYLYRIICRRAPLALEAGLAWRVPHDLDASAMQAAADLLVGKHDFTTFRSAHCQAKSPVKSIDTVTVSQADGIIRLEVSARSFLHNQVRSIAGSLKMVGEGAWTIGRFKEALEAADRSKCGPVAPPDGLYLVGVDYPDR